MSPLESDQQGADTLYVRGSQQSIFLGLGRNEQEEDFWGASSILVPELSYFHRSNQVTKKYKTSSAVHFYMRTFIKECNSWTEVKGNSIPLEVILSPRTQGIFV